MSPTRTLRNQINFAYSLDPVLCVSTSADFIMSAETVISALLRDWLDSGASGDWIRNYTVIGLAGDGEDIRHE